jgi:uncharacterized protein YjbI with pentapeptide repeats
MANDQHVALLKQGVAVWNEWRLRNPDTRPDLRQVSLIGAILSEANLTGALLSGAILRGAPPTSGGQKLSKFSGSSMLST